MGQEVYTFVILHENMADGNDRYRMCGGVQKNLLDIILGKNFEKVLTFLILLSAGFVPAVKPALYRHPVTTLLF